MNLGDPVWRAVRDHTRLHLFDHWPSLRTEAQLRCDLVRVDGCSAIEHVVVACQTAQQVVAAAPRGMPVFKRKGHDALPLQAGIRLDLGTCHARMAVGPTQWQSDSRCRDLADRPVRCDSVTQIAVAVAHCPDWDHAQFLFNPRHQEASMGAALSGRFPRGSMSTLFDQVAGKFADDIDDMIGCGRYVRGDIFIDLATRMLPPKAQVLDYGCGPGRLSGLLAARGFRVHGVDTSPGMIEQARTLIKPGSTLSFQPIQDPADALPANSFDAIVCSSVIEYVADADGLLRQFKAALRPQGHLVISFANATSYIRKQWQREAGGNPMGPGQHHVWTWQQFRKLLERNGFVAKTQPLYFESPWDRHVWGKWARRSAHVGSLGVTVAGVNDAHAA
jgi:2-polyprenyl-3-methyl-5-hydroxy-6-metoxy-1,4-benzoquinol methylase